MRERTKSMPKITSTVITFVMKKRKRLETSKIPSRQIISSIHSNIEPARNIIGRKKMNMI